jgi:hypothetical protein
MGGDGAAGERGCGWVGMARWSRHRSQAPRGTGSSGRGTRGGRRLESEDGVAESEDGWARRVVAFNRWSGCEISDTGEEEEEAAESAELANADAQ